METHEDRQVEAYYQRVMEGHVYIQDTIDLWLHVVDQQVRRRTRPLRLLELGSHAGIITRALLQQTPDLDIIVCDEDPTLVRIARRRVQNERVQYHVGAIEDLAETVDLVVSVARHHHLPHDYLGAVRRLLRPDGVYVLADELCPEYCHGAQAERIARAELIHMAGGYVLTTHDEVRAFQVDGVVPTHALELERLRQRALWRWYRFVVDDAIDRGYFDVAASELESTHDDLITGSQAEHKYSPLVVERQLALSGFRQLSKKLVGPANDPERQSMFVFEYGTN